MQVNSRSQSDFFATCAAGPSAAVPVTSLHGGYGAVGKPISSFRHFVDMHSLHPGREKSSRGVPLLVLPPVVATPAAATVAVIVAEVPPIGSAVLPIGTLALVPPADIWLPTVVDDTTAPPAPPTFALPPPDALLPPTDMLPPLGEGATPAPAAPGTPTMDALPPFTLEGIPAGDYEVMAWAPRVRPQRRSITVTGDEAIMEFALTR